MKCSLAGHKFQFFPCLLDNDALISVLLLMHLQPSSCLRSRNAALQQMVAIVFTHQHFMFAFSHVCSKEKAVIEFLMALHIVH